jgi:hypothetical protein
MFSVVGLTLDDVWSGALPQVRLAKALDDSKNGQKVRSDAAHRLVVYTTDPNNTQGLVERTKYKDRGTFLTVLYFNQAAVQACHDLHIPLRILEHVDEQSLPAGKVVAFEYPPVPAVK